MTLIILSVQTYDFDSKFELEAFIIFLTYSIYFLKNKLSFVFFNYGLIIILFYNSKI